jgi:2-isopropylmalate synthase
MEDRVFIFDTTLRDGEQSPGCSMNFEEKIRMARQIQLLCVDVIEAGFPISSVGDFESVRLIAEKIKTCTVAALARAVKPDIDRAWEAIREAAKPRIHIFIATSDLHLKYKLKKSREQVLKDAVWAVQYAKSLCDDVEFSCEDASRSDINYLCEIVEATIKAGAAIINLPDTVGYAIPDEYGAMFRMIRERVPNIGSAVLSSHCHNDLGLAVANSIAAIQNGARQIECTINGIGERAGNASLEEIVMAIKTRHEKLGLKTNVDAEEIYKSSKLLSSLTGMMVQRNKAIVGANAFAHEAGIHQDGMLKSPLTYEIMTPQSYQLTDEELQHAYQLFCSIADQKKEIFDEDLETILESGVSSIEEVYHLANLQITSGTNLRPTATIELKQGDQLLIDSATGDGPVDAAYKAVERITGVVGKLTEYSIKSVHSGHDAIGEVFVRVDFNGLLFNGRAASTDIISGSVSAYIEALNRALASKKRKEEQQKKIVPTDSVTA